MKEKELKAAQEYFTFWLWSWMVFLYYTTLILIYDVLHSFSIYYIQFKEFKILWGPEAG